MSEDGDGGGNGSSSSSSLDGSKDVELDLSLTESSGSVLRFVGGEERERSASSEQGKD